MKITLKAARVNKNLTQPEAAEKLGIAVDTLVQWEKGRTFPDAPMIDKMTGLYGVTYDELNFLPGNNG